MSARDDLVDVVAELRQIAADIAKANINGFGNAITAQADRLEAMLDAEPVAWIPVSERLPDADDRYAVMYQQGRQHKAWTLDYSVTDGWQGVMPEWTVTHWMPLPARPEAK